MTPDDRRRTAVDRLETVIAEKQADLAAGTVVTERVPAVLAGLGADHDELARSLARTGEGERARQVYGEAAVYYLASATESGERREMLPPDQRQDDPTTLSHALQRAILARDDELVECAARQTLLLDRRALAESDNATYYAAKLLAAVAVDGDWDRYADDLRESTRDVDGRPTVLAGVLEGIANRDVDAVTLGLRGLLDGGDRPGDPDRVDDHVAALCALAVDAGLDVAVDAPTVPACLVPDATPDARVVTPSGDDRRSPDVHRDPESGRYVLVERVDAPESGVVTADDLPETGGHRLLSDAWVEGVLADLADADDPEARDLARDLAAARESDDLVRRLTVATDRAGGAAIDRSVYDLGIDVVEVVPDREA